MPQIIEGSLTFDFPTKFKVQKLDDSAFYRRHFQSFASGQKAVDIVAFDTANPELWLTANPELWLIEAKDYRQHPRTKTLDLAEEIAQKVSASLACLCAMRANANVETEKNFALQALKKITLRVILHLEERHITTKARLAKSPNSITADVQMKLKQRLRVIDPHPKILSISRANTLPWTVK